MHADIKLLLNWQVGSAVCQSRRLVLVILDCMFWRRALFHLPSCHQLIDWPFCCDRLQTGTSEFSASTHTQDYSLGRCPPLSSKRWKHSRWVSRRGLANGLLPYLCWLFVPFQPAQKSSCDLSVWLLSLVFDSMAACNWFACCFHQVSREKQQLHHCSSLLQARDQL